MNAGRFRFEPEQCRVGKPVGRAGASTDTHGFAILDHVRRHVPHVMNSRFRAVTTSPLGTVAMTSREGGRVVTEGSPGTDPPTDRTTADHHVGLIAGTVDSTPLHFHVALADDAYLQLDDVVVTVRGVPGVGPVMTSGVVTEVIARHEGASFGSDVFLINDGILPAKVQEIAEVMTTRVDPECYIPPRPGMPARRATGGRAGAGAEEATGGLAGALPGLAGRLRCPDESRSLIGARRRSALSTVRTPRAITRPRRSHAGPQPRQASRAMTWWHLGCISALPENADTRKVDQ